MPRRKAQKGRGAGEGAAPVAAPALPPAEATSYEDAGFPCPKVQGLNLRILYPSPHGMLRVGLVSSWWFGWLSHWTGTRTRAHTMSPEGSCEHCRQGLIPRWCAYALCVASAQSGVSIVQVSLQAWQSCPDLSARHGALRGLALTLRRRGAGTQQATEATIEAGSWVTGPPEERDVRPYLSRWWDQPEDWLEWQGGPHRTGIAPPSGWKGGTP